MNLKLIKQKDFSLLLLGKLVSLLGSNMQQFALSLYVLALTGSASVFASVLAITIFPRLILSPIAGVFGDWFDRKRTIVLLDLVNAIIIGAFAIIFILNRTLTIPMIYVFVILLEVTEIFFGSAMSAVMPSIVKKEELLEANSLSSFVMNVGNLLAPVLAALIYGSFGMKVILIVNSISFLLSAISEMFINIPKHHKTPEKINFKSFRTDFMEGVKLIKSNKLISTMISLGTIINFCIAPLFGIGLIFIIKEVLKSSDLQFGIFQMAFSASMIVVPLFSSKIFKKIKIGKLCYIGFTFISILVLALSLIASNLFMNIFNSSIVTYVAILIVSFLVGMTVTTANIALGTLFTQVTPIELMGRTSTVFNLAVTVSVPVGQMLFGFMYDIISPSIVIAVSGVILFLAIMVYKSPLISYEDTHNVRCEEV